MKTHKTLLKTIFPLLALPAWVFACILSSQFLLGFIFSSILKDAVKSPAWLTIFSAAVYTLSIWLITLLPYRFYKKWRTNREELGLSGLPTWTDLLLAPIGFVPYFIISAVSTAIFSIFPWFNANQTQNVLFNHFLSPGGKILAFLTLAVVAPIAEELIFRGWLYGKLRARTNLVVSIFITSLLFGIVHFQWNVGVNVFGMSIIMCLLREITGTVYSGIFLHIIKNSIAFFLLFVAGVA